MPDHFFITGWIRREAYTLPITHLSDLFNAERKTEGLDGVVA